MSMAGRGATQYMLELCSSDKIYLPFDKSLLLCLCMIHMEYDATRYFRGEKSQQNSNDRSNNRFGEHLQNSTLGLCALEIQDWTRLFNWAFKCTKWANDEWSIMKHNNLCPDWIICILKCKRVELFNWAFNIHVIQMGSTLELERLYNPTLKIYSDGLGIMVCLDVGVGRDPANHHLRWDYALYEGENSPIPPKLRKRSWR